MSFESLVVDYGLPVIFVGAGTEGEAAAGAALQMFSDVR
jgi:hypothetical protein